MGSNEQRSTTLVLALMVGTMGAVFLASRHVRTGSMALVAAGCLGGLGLLLDLADWRRQRHSGRRASSGAPRVGPKRKGLRTRSEGRAVHAKSRPTVWVGEMGTTSLLASQSVLYGSLVAGILATGRAPGCDDSCRPCWRRGVGLDRPIYGGFRTMSVVTAPTRKNTKAATNKAAAARIR